MEQNKMGTKAVFPLLMSMAFPPMLSMLVQSLYNIVDSVYVAQISQDAITAVSLAFPIQNFLLAVAVGTGVGMNSYISRKLGMRDIKEANNAVTHGILLAVISSIVQEYGASFNIGLFGDETEAKYQEFVGKLEEAGLSKVMEECRTQYETFCERKGQE